MPVRIGAPLLKATLKQGQYYHHLGLGYGRHFRLSVQHVVRQVFLDVKVQGQSRGGGDADLAFTPVTVAGPRRDEHVPSWEEEERPF
jgi:hypothetical protein